MLGFRSSMCPAFDHYGRGIGPLERVVAMLTQMIDPRDRQGKAITITVAFTFRCTSTITGIDHDHDHDHDHEGDRAP